MKISFDIGGVISKYPNVFKPMISHLKFGGAEVFIITDMPKQQADDIILENGIDIDLSHILCGNYQKYGDNCKKKVIEDYGIHIHIDDHPGYCAHTSCISLFIWPNPELPYFAPEFESSNEPSFVRLKAQNTKTT